MPLLHLAPTGRHGRLPSFLMSPRSKRPRRWIWPLRQLAMDAVLHISEYADEVPPPRLPHIAPLPVRTAWQECLVVLHIVGSWQTLADVRRFAKVCDRFQKHLLVAVILWIWGEHVASQMLRSLGIGWRECRGSAAGSCVADSRLFRTVWIPPAMCSRLVRWVDNLQSKRFRYSSSSCLSRHERLLAGPKQRPRPHPSGTSRRPVPKPRRPPVSKRPRVAGLEVNGRLVRSRASLKAAPRRMMEGFATWKRLMWIGRGENARIRERQLGFRARETTGKWGPGKSRPFRPPRLDARRRQCSARRG